MSRTLQLLPDRPPATPSLQDSDPIASLVDNQPSPAVRELSLDDSSWPVAASYLVLPTIHSRPSCCDGAVFGRAALAAAGVRMPTYRSQPRMGRDAPVAIQVQYHKPLAIAGHLKTVAFTSPPCFRV